MMQAQLKTQARFTYGAEEISKKVSHVQMSGLLGHIDTVEHAEGWRQYRVEASNSSRGHEVPVTRLQDTIHHIVYTCRPLKTSQIVQCLST